MTCQGILTLSLGQKKQCRVLNSGGMIISVFRKVYSGGHGEEGLESSKGDPGNGCLIHLCKTRWRPGTKLLWDGEWEAGVREGIFAHCQTSWWKKSF